MDFVTIHPFDTNCQANVWTDEKMAPPVCVDLADEQMRHILDQSDYEGDDFEDGNASDNEYNPPVEEDMISSESETDEDEPLLAPPPPPVPGRGRRQSNRDRSRGSRSRSSFRARMPPQRKVSIRQMELLVEFAESHRDIALGRFPGGLQAVRSIREAWGSITVHLNSVADGITKTPNQWRRYWIEFKAKTKTKAADSRRNASATGGGPNKLVPLNEIEKRVLAIIGPVAVEGLPGVRLPINIPLVNETEDPADSGITEPDPLISSPSTTTTPLSSAPYPISIEPPMEVEWLEEEMPSSLGLQPESQTFELPPSAETQPTATDDIPTQPEVASIEHRHAHSSSPARRSRSRRQNHRDDRVPRWAYDIESRRIAAQERHAAAMEEIVSLIREIRNDVRRHLAEGR